MSKIHIIRVIIPLLAVSPSVFKQIRRWDVQGIGDSFDHIHRGVSRAVLHMTQLGQANLRCACQLHLSHIRLVSIPHDVVAQYFSQFHIHLPFHFKGKIWKWQAVYPGADIRAHIFHILWGISVSSVHAWPAAIRPARGHSIPAGYRG